MGQEMNAFNINHEEYVQCWRTWNLGTLEDCFGGVLVPNHLFILTNKGEVFRRLPECNWFQGFCNYDMQVVAYCYSIKQRT